MWLRVVGVHSCGLEHSSEIFGSLGGVTATLAPAAWQLSAVELTAEIVVREESLRTAFAGVPELAAEAEGRGLGRSLG